MKNILCFLLTIFLFSCATLDSIVDMRSTLERNDNAQQILDQLNDPELKKGKIFVLSRHKNDVAIKIRVNEEVFIIRREEIQSFLLRLSLINSFITCMPIVAHITMTKLHNSSPVI